MGGITQKFGRALDVNAARDRELQSTARDLAAQTKAFSNTNADLRFIADNLEERDQRSKWDWATLATAMIIAAALAGGGAVFFTKQQLDTANFQDAIGYIQNDDDAYWFRSASASIVQDRDGTHYCAIAMPNYVVPEQEE